MHFTHVMTLVAVITSANGFSFSEVRSTISEKYNALFTRVPAPMIEERAACPAIWTTIVGDLTKMFLDTSVSPSQCNDDARAAIRVCTFPFPYTKNHSQLTDQAAFHDCGTWDTTQGSTGGCDGSLILAKEAYERPENNGLQDISDKLLALQKKYASNGVSVADVIQVASSVAIVACPGGPQVKTYVGRKDSSVGNPG
jgi:hypothetical protein